MWKASDKREYFEWLVLMEGLNMTKKNSMKVTLLGNHPKAGEDLPHLLINASTHFQRKQVN